jgi:hypothetical protein
VKIKQLFCITGPHFERGYIEKYGFEPYTDINEPLFISGFGKEIHKNLDRIEKHKSLILLRWAGGDLIWFLAHPKEQARMVAMKNIHHIAVSRCLEKDLQTMGVPYKFCPISVFKNADIKPEPLGDCIYVYKAGSLQYGCDIIRRLQTVLPFCFIKSESAFDFTREQLLEVYKQCFIGLRITQHDGIANTACEMGLMGRRMIHNGDLPNCIPYDRNNFQAIVKAIQDEFDNRLTADYNKVAQDVFNYLDVGEDWLNTEYYE